MPGMRCIEIRFRSISGRLINSRKSIAPCGRLSLCPSYKMSKSVLQNVQIHAKLIKSSLLHEVTFAAFDYLCMMSVINAMRTYLIKQNIHQTITE